MGARLWIQRRHVISTALDARVRSQVITAVPRSLVALTWSHRRATVFPAAPTANANFSGLTGWPVLAHISLLG